MNETSSDPGSSEDPWDVIIVGSGPAGLTCSIFTARAGLSTLLVNHGASILNRNAHIENFPGFPAGVNPRLLLTMIEDQAGRNGATLQEAKVQRVARSNGLFEVGTDEGPLHAKRLVAATKSTPDYLAPLDPDLRDTGSKTYLQPDEAGRTEIDGLYAAGRVADQYHQAIVSAGHGAKVGITLVEDADPDFYHDWVAPKGYFTLRDREVPKGCEEISKKERKQRERESIEVMQEYFSDPFEASPHPHPSLEGKEGFDA